MRSLKSFLHRWHSDEEGSIAVETLMMVPLLSWALLSTLAYFDAYRAESISQKASLTIADMVSRETQLIDSNYIRGARELLRFLTLGDNWPDLRVSVVYWDANQNKLKRAWSQERGPRRGLTHTEVAELSNSVPILSHQERLIIVETWTEYEPMYSVGLSPFTMETFTFISPRFVSQVCYQHNEGSPTRC